MLPDICPVCGGPIVTEPGAADKKCINPNCPAQLERHLINFVGRDAMDIKGFGEEIVLTLVSQGYLRDIADIYRLKDHREELLLKKVIGLEKSTDKLLAAIEKSKENEPWRLLAGLAIENVGRTSARTLMNRFGSLRELADADIETLLTVPDIGGVTAGTIRSFFDAEENRKLLDELLELGLRMESTDNDRSDELAGRTYVVTGEVTQFRNRAELVEFIEKRGGKCAGSVSKKTFALINNDLTSMSGKNKKAKELGIPILAKELGIPILTEEEFLKGLEGKDNNADQSTE